MELPQDLADTPLPEDPCHLELLLASLGFKVRAIDGLVGVKGHELDTLEEDDQMRARWYDLFESVEVFLEPVLSPPDDGRKTAGSWKWNGTVGDFYDRGEAEHPTSYSTLQQLLASITWTIDPSREWLDRVSVLSWTYVDRLRSFLGTSH